jgi:hypothetical protein
MSLTSKSPRRVALVALKVGQEVLDPYAHRYAPKKFTQPQLFVCLVLKCFFKTDYRGVEQYLLDMPGICQAIGLKEVPDHSTLHKAAQRFFGKAITDESLDATVRLMMRRPHAKRLAIDASGFEAHHISRYFINRRARADKDTVKEAYQTTTYRRFPKLGLAVDCDSHLVLAAHPCRGPTPDIKHIERVVFPAWAKARIGTVIGDAGYDAEWVHEMLRRDYGVRTLIRAGIGRPTDKPPTGYWRRWMTSHLEHTSYAQRWQVETVFSMIKRRLGDSLNAVSYWTQCRALHLLAVTHNVMIALPTERFSTEQDKYIY